MSLPCYARKDSSGVFATVDSLDAQGLELGGDGTYIWGITPNYTYPNGTIITGTPFIFSSGKYTWDGKTLMLVDAQRLGPTTGLVSGNVIRLQTREHQYEFLKLPQLPPG